MSANDEKKTLAQDPLEGLLADDPQMLEAIKLVINGATLADAKGISKKQLEGLYAAAYQVYQAGDYAKAEAVFATLCLLNHLEKRFWLGLGGARQQLGKHAEATQAFGMASMQDLHDPVPPLHAGMCFLALKDKKNAANAFRQAVIVAGDRPEQSASKKQGQAMLDLLGAPLYETENAQGA
ncbi:MAG: SycD/LcrH family type III secretion system chaperone [Deltaproteobacteria bacterium]|jgi:type III secretion system low calcium response chaperone LcrH/SycD|nr:SycD/LcrH family type III secretion system chaperone [Deltaproteobacteria bacterium]